MDATKPTDAELISTHPIYIREVRAAVNALSSVGGIGVTVLPIPAGTVALAVGTDLGAYGYEIVLVSAIGAVNIATITDGVQGQVKVFVFQDNDVSFVDGLALNGRIYLNQLPALSSFNGQINDVLTLVNIGGNGSTLQGYWKEISRQIALK